MASALTGSIFSGWRFPRLRVPLMDNSQQQKDSTLACGQLVEITNFYMPWEHRVCNECLNTNPYAIWLVKIGCFKPHVHNTALFVTVVIEHERMKMIFITALPSNSCNSHGRDVEMCNTSKCISPAVCGQAHSAYEFDTWNTKKCLIDTNGSGVSTIVKANLPTQSPSQVCQLCLQSNPNTLWLSWLKCIRPSDHSACPTVDVVANAVSKKLVEVRPLPGDVSTMRQVDWCRGYHCTGSSCSSAHSPEELNYWKWQIAIAFFEKNDSQFLELHKSYKYPDEVSPCFVESLETPLSRENYKSKYHKLIYLEEIESSRRIIQECDSNEVEIVIDFFPAYNQDEITSDDSVIPPKVYLHGLSSTAIDHASSTRCTAVVSLQIPGSKKPVYTADVQNTPDYENMALTLTLPSTSSFFCHFSPEEATRCLATVHFEVSHSHNRTLHRIIDSAPPAIIQKLLPRHPLSPCPRPIKVNSTLVGRVKLDENYQKAALSKILKCSPSAPFLLLGPFGTGKTYLLAAAVVKVLEEDAQCNILVCTHQNRCADSLCQHIQANMGRAKTKEYIVRVVPPQEQLEHATRRLGPDIKVLLANDRGLYEDWQVIVTTFTTAFHFFSQRDFFYFSHIFVDEGAQCSEPEVLGALVLAKSHTKVIVVGDNKQIGPHVRVVSDKARENGLGASLLERLFDHYTLNKQLLSSHTATLLTNYRCHPSILMMASSLFYEHTLVSRSTSKAHPMAPYPLIMVCTSFEENGFENLPVENYEEANLLISKMIEFIQSWPWRDECRQPIGLLASSKQQVACLRQLWKRRRYKLSYQERSVPVEILPTYNIQGEEFSAVFLSTCEATDGFGMPSNRINSICNEFVFNTVVTRARSLICVAGNPFQLIHMGSDFTINCWLEYIRRCLQCETLLVDSYSLEAAHEHFFNAKFETLFKKVGVIESLVKVAEQECQEFDAIIERYVNDLQKRKDYKVAKNLVQGPAGDLHWVDEASTGTHRDKKNIVWCKLDCKSFRKVTATSVNEPGTQLQLSGLSKRRCGFHGDIVRVDLRNQCVLLDEQTETAIRNTHFGESFLCRVSPYNPIRFFPVDDRYPKFVNLPMLTKDQNAVNEVVCFDPSSLNSVPKVSDFIPMECAVKMVFVVKFLGWKKGSCYPLGIIVGALPSAQSPLVADLLLRLIHSVPSASYPEFTPVPIEKRFNTSDSLTCYNDAFTIDSKGADDRDDALTCRLISPSSKTNTQAYEIGVHIVDIQRCIPKGSRLDTIAFQRGCSFYRSANSCVSSMLPPSLVESTFSFSPDAVRRTQSVLTRFQFKNGRIQLLGEPTFVECQVQSSLCLTYEEAERFLCRELTFPPDYNLEVKRNTYNSKLSRGLPLEAKLQILWQIALFLRKRRLGADGAYSYRQREGHKPCPEARHLVEEFMIWANSKVAERVIKAYPRCTVVRVQNKPNKEEVDKLIRSYSGVMSASLDLKALLPKKTLTQVRDVVVLKSTHRAMKAYLDRGLVRYACHQVQFEHHHPMIAIVTAKLRKASSGSVYKRTDQTKPEYWHDGLHLKQYSHFTSPMRRYGDIVMQRLLHSAIHGLPCPYKTTKEMDDICSAITNSFKCSNDYDRSVRKLDLSLALQDSCRQVEASVVKNPQAGSFRFIFLGLESGELSPSESQVALKHLKANAVPSEWAKSAPGDERERQGAVTHFKWQAKIASFTNNLNQTFSRKDLQLAASVSKQAERYASINIFSPDGPGGQQSCLNETELPMEIVPLTVTVPRAQWNSLLSAVKNDPQTITVGSLTKHLPILNPPSSRALSMPSESALCVYTVNRRLSEEEVLHVQIGSSYQDTQQLLTPCVQLVEVAPELRICPQHNSGPSKCFTGDDQLITSASKQRYASIHEYYTMWQRVLLAEAAVGSVADTELLLIKDVQLHWPKLEPQLNSSGCTTYALPVNTNDTKTGARMELPDNFVSLSYDFFRFTSGDLVCVRYDVTTESGADVCRSVFHMVVHHVDKRTVEKRVLRGVTIYLRFVCKSMNKIGHTMGRILMGMPLSINDKLNVKCELQLIPLTLPFRRVHRSLHNLMFEESSSSSFEHSLAEKVALGIAKTANFDNPPSVRSFLSDEQVSIATSLWSFQKRRTGSGRKKLNKFQKEAIDLATSNQFTLIQGPPGTGKSVTGAHIAYALAMKLRKKRLSTGQEGPRVVRTAADGKVTIAKRTPCVMYCAPSNHAVNVVLELLTCRDSPAKKELKIIRVFSKLIEQADYPGPKSHELLFHKSSSPNAKCHPNQKEYALHEMVRRAKPEILEYDRRFQTLQKQGKVPSQSLRDEYRSLLFRTELTVLSENVDVVLCTCNEASSHRLMNSVNPVYCIIDECAMATEPECMVPICNSEHVVLIGDHQQLSPVIKNKKAEEMGLGTSLFLRYVTSSSGRPPQPPLQKPYMLKIQYRMHPELCKFPSKEFYGGQLQTDPSIIAERKADRESSLNFWPPGRPFVFVDVVGTEEKHCPGQKGNVSLDSKFNSDEAAKIVEIIEVLMKRHQITAQTIAVLTPYSAQKEEISRFLKRSRLENITVKTITESQGSEYGIVLLSTVRSMKIKEKLQADIGWLRSNLGFVTDRNRICVGITRAKYGLVIVGNGTLLSYDETWRRLIDYYKQNKCFKDSSFPARLAGPKKGGATRK